MLNMLKPRAKAMWHKNKEITWCSLIRVQFVVKDITRNSLLFVTTKLYTKGFINITASVVERVSGMHLILEPI